MKNIKYRLCLAFTIGSLYSSLYDYIGKTSEESVFTVYDSLFVGLCISSLIVISMLASIEYYKNKK